MIAWSEITVTILVKISHMFLFFNTYTIRCLTSLILHLTIQIPPSGWARVSRMSQLDAFSDGDERQAYNLIG